MLSLANILIFCLIAFLYLHIYFHIKISDELEVYNLKILKKEELEKVCDFKQPITFPHNFTGNLMYINQEFIKTNYIKSVVSLCDSSKTSLDSDMYSLTDLSHAYLAMQSNKIIENNEAFLKNTFLINKIKKHDEFLRPALLASSKYDLIMGLSNSYTPLKYEINYRNFFYVTEGNVKIKLIPPDSIISSNIIRDYELLQFRSSYNPWKKSNTELKSIEIELNPGEILFIPAYWWYSMLCSEPSTIISFKYQTYVSMLSIIPKLCLHVVQKNNIKPFFSEKRQIISPSYLSNNNKRKKNSKGKSCHKIGKKKLKESIKESIKESNS